MTIELKDLERFLPVFAPAVVTAAMLTCEAAAIGRELARSEIVEIKDAVDIAVNRYVRDTRLRMNNTGAGLDDQVYIDMAEEMKQKIFDNAWVLVQITTNEAKSRLYNG